MALALTSEVRAAAIVSLQNANNIGVVGLIGATVSNTGTVTASENAIEGIANTGNNSLTIAGSGTTKTLTGEVYYSNNSNQVSGCTHASAGCALDSSDLAPGGALVNAATADFTAASALSANQTFGTVSGGSIGDNGHNNDTNVVSISAVNLTSNLTITGTAADYFILQIAGNLNLNTYSIQLGGGLVASHVLFVLTGTSGTPVVNIGSSDGLYGTLLSNNGKYSFTIDGTVHGAVINNLGITLGSGANVTGGTDTFVGTPEPATLGLFAAGLGGIALLRRNRLKRKPGHQS